ncbi:MAG: hypothetical protein JSV20_09585 [Candidatus Bathyarchaeota archaeon]|nr:MAG: hypothetical protein JSV20_09585 [Candidatus Bathyarchaeota archaeon]
MNSNFSRNDKGHLLIEGIDTIELGNRFGTPLYVVCEEKVRNNYRNFKKNFTKYYDKNIVAYSYKTNFLPAICTILKNEGAWAEIVSALELSIARKIQVNPSKIIFNGPCKSDEVLLEALRLGVSVINIDSLSELERLSNLIHKTGITANVGVRLHNPFEKGKIPSRFGLDIKKAFTACKLIGKNQRMNYRGIHIHLGTQITNINSYIMIIKYAADFMANLHSKLDLNTIFLNIGGGFPSHQKPLYAIDDPWPAPSLKEYASKIGSTLEANHNKINYPYLVLEPGRAIVSSSSYLITKIVAIKSIDRAGKWIILDSGLNIVPEAEYFYYKTIPASHHKGEREKVHIGGPLCMLEDIIGLNRRLPKLQEGDILVIPDVGAYNISLSWQFIKPRPNICMIHKNGVELIRKTETVDDILRLDSIPKHLITNQIAKED